MSHESICIFCGHTYGSYVGNQVGCRHFYQRQECVAYGHDFRGPGTGCKRLCGVSSSIRHQDAIAPEFSTYVWNGVVVTWRTSIRSMAQVAVRASNERMALANTDLATDDETVIRVKADASAEPDYATVLPRDLLELREEVANLRRQLEIYRAQKRRPQVACDNGWDVED